MATDKVETKPKAPETVKVVVRNLPKTDVDLDTSGLPKEFEEWKDNIETSYVLESVDSMDLNDSIRVYLGFKEMKDALEFHKHFDGAQFEDNQLIVELAPFPKLPKPQRSKVDSKQSTIDQDPEYQTFAESYENESTMKPKEGSVQANQEQLLKDLEKRRDEKAQVEAEVTPLIQSIIDARNKKGELAKSREEERRKKETEAVANRKKRDEERKRMLDQKEKRLKEQREKERQQKAKPIAEDENKKRPILEIDSVRNPDTEKKTVLLNKETKDAKKDVYDSSLGANGDRVKENEKESNSKTTTSKSTRLKDLPSLQIYRPAAKNTGKSTADAALEDKPNSFLDREVESSVERPGKPRNGAPRGRGGSHSYREIKPSKANGGGSAAPYASAGSAYSSRGDRRKDSKRDPQLASAGKGNMKPSSDVTSVSGNNSRRNSRDEIKYEKQNSGKSESSESEVVSDSKKQGPVIVKYPKENEPAGNVQNAPKSSSRGGGKGPGKVSQRRHEEEWEWGSGYDDGYGYYDNGPHHYHTSSWTSRSRGGGGARDPGSQSARLSYSTRSYEQKGYSRSSYDFDRNEKRAPAKFTTDKKHSRPNNEETKSNESSKPPRFSDKRRAIATASNADNP